MNPFIYYIHRITDSGYTELKNAAGWKTLPIIIIVLALTSIIMPASAYSQHNPMWSARPRALNQVLDYSTGVAIIGSSLYVTHEFNDYSTNHNGVALTVHSLSDGSMISSATYTYKGQGDMYSTDSIAYNGKILISGFIIDQNTGATGYVIEVDPNTLSIVKSYGLDRTSNGYDVIFNGVCTDSSGHIYAVGAEIDQGNHTSFTLVARFDPSQSIVTWATIKALDQQGNILNTTAYSCIVEPSLGLYVVGSVLYYDNSLKSLFTTDVALIELSTSDLSILNYNFISQVNSQGWVIAPQPVDIASINGRILVAFSYADELPDPNNPTYGAAIVGLDHSLQILWRKNYATSYDEAFTTISTGIGGWYVVGGWTNNDYSTGLGTNYRHGLLLALDNANNLQRAFIYGGNNNARVWDVAVDNNGFVYSVGSDYSNKLLIYDITQEASSNIQRRNPLSGTVNYDAAHRERLARLTRHENLGLLIEAHGTRKMNVKLDIVAGGVGIRVTPNGQSSSVVIAYNYQADPPPPVPEPRLVVLMATIGTLVYLVYRFTRNL